MPNVNASEERWNKDPVRKCKFCNFTTKFRSYLGQHIKNSHDFIGKIAQCHLCPYNSISTIDLKAHIERVHKNKPHPTNKVDVLVECRFCSYSKVKTSQLHLNSHINRIHDKLGTYCCNWVRVDTISDALKCMFCLYSSKCHSCLNQHIRKCHDLLRNNTQCPSCPYSSIRASDVKAHIERVHDTTIVRTQFVAQCMFCNYFSYNLNDLARSKLNLHRHINKIHDEMKGLSQCPSCSYSSFNSNDVKKHITGVHEGKPYLNSIKQCSLCTFETTKKSRLRKHINVVHKKLCVCKYFETCDFTAIDKSEIDRHIELKHKKQEQSLTCSRCGYSSYRESDLKKHIKQVHDKVFDQFCDKCDFSCSLPTDLSQHKNKVHEEGNKVCKVCNLAFDSLLQLNKHRRIHKEVSFTCMECSYPAESQFMLKVHRWEAHKSSICLSCDYVGSNYTDLNQHSLSIHKISPNVRKICTECDFSAYNSYDMEVHMKQHYNEARKQRSKKCPTCSYTCKWAYQLKNHIDSIHAITGFENEIHCKSIDSGISDPLRTI